MLFSDSVIFINNLQAGKKLFMVFYFCHRILVNVSKNMEDIETELDCNTNI